MSDIAGRVSQVHALDNGKGVQYLINEAYKVLGNPIVIHNMEYELLYCAENVVSDDRLWNEIVKNGFFSDESIHFFLEECFIDEVANSKTIALLSSDKLKYERLYGRVLNGYNDTVADLITVACDSPFEDGDALVFEAICEKLSQEISAIDSFNNYGILYHEQLINKLLDDNIDDKVIYSGHLSNLYENLKANLYIVAADIGECKTDTKSLGDFRDSFKKMQPELKYAAYSNRIVIIASSDETVPDIDRDLHKLSAFFTDNDIRTGISSCFDNLYKLRKYYDEAVLALLRENNKNTGI